MARWEYVIRCEFYGAQYELATRKQSKWRSSFPFSLLKRTEHTRPESWIDLSNADGYTRERILRTLDGGAPNGFFFALAVRRLNDWVTQVRDAARAAIPRLANATDPKYVVDALCAMLPEWSAWGRMTELDRKAILDLVAVKEIALELMDRVISSPTGPMPQVLAQILRTAVLDDYLTAIAMRAVQPAVRAKAYRVLLLREATWLDGSRWRWTDVRYCEGRVEKTQDSRKLTVIPTLLDCLYAAASDRSPIVRSVASEALIREMNTPGVPAVVLARRFATDVSESVAGRGNFILKQLGELL